MKQFTVQSKKRNQMINITSLISDIVKDSTIDSGIAVIFTPHTTAAITINENADPDVKNDMLKGLKIITPNRLSYGHMEGNSDAHIKSSLIGVDQTIIIENNEPQLGTWQGIYFCEFDGPRTRTVYVKLIKE